MPPPITRRWSLQQADPLWVQQLHAALGIPHPLCEVLVLRGITSYEEARAFFRPALDALLDPFLMQDMAAAVNRITAAIAKGERILIYGDYDVDGTTSVAVVYSFLHTLHSNIDYYIPHRYTEGYGVSTQGIDYAAAQGITLIIALDCGIKAVDKVKYAQSLGIDFIICDHHLPGDELPAAIAILDPKRADCPYPYKELSGCGIGFKLIQAFAMQQGIPTDRVMQYLDLVCLSIASDIVPITGENRILAYHGMERLNKNPSPGIRKLKESTGVQREMDISDMVFTLGPRINAAGRIDDARVAVRLLIGAEGSDEILLHAQSLQQLNNERKDLDRNITEQALEMLYADELTPERSSTVLYRADWHKGVIGIVASRLTDYYYRPTVILTQSNGIVTGSARSVRGFDLYEAIYACREHLIQFGGHAFAAGLTMLEKDVAGFTEKFEQVVNSCITPAQRVPEIVIDAEIGLEDITPKFYRIIQQMSPFGPGNMKPVFLLRGLMDTGWSRVLKETHLKCSIRLPNGQAIDGIGFGLGYRYDIVRKGAFDICAQIEENVWNGNATLQLVIKDIREAEA